MAQAAEWFAFATGVVYILLIVRRHRVGWLFGAVSSGVLAVLALRAHLPMQALLQLFYVAAATYGWRTWKAEAGAQQVGLWTLKGHALAVLGCVLVSLVLARLLAREAYSAWPLLDSLVACAGLFATWMVARVYLENWIYWIVIDSLSIYLYYAQDLRAGALLFVVYLGISIGGLVTWTRIYRKQVAAP
jgi:nicotinamide mononucleotide transporter